MDGLILVDKPQHCTSHDVVAHIRSLLQVRKAGHFGTLDPMATGLIIIALGHTTRLFPFYSKRDKIYTGRIRLGLATDTYDAEGKPTSSPNSDYPTSERLASAMSAFEGDIDQVPPPYSAKKLHGKPLYSLARAQRPASVPPCRIHVHYFRMTAYHPPDVDFEARGSSGTYIRALAHDLGKSIGCGAHLSALRRMSIGEFSLDDAHDMDTLRNYSEAERIPEIIIPLENLLPEFPKIILNETGAQRAGNGNLILPEHIIKIIPPSLYGCRPRSIGDGETYRLFSEQGQLFAFGKRAEAHQALHPFLVMAPDNDTH